MEFIVQYLLLCNAAAYPNLLDPTLEGALERLGRAKLISPGRVAALCSAAVLWRGVQGVLRATVDGRFDPGRASGLVRGALFKAAGETDMSALTAAIDATAGAVQEAFAETVVGAADAADDPKPNEENRNERK